MAVAVSVSESVSVKTDTDTETATETGTETVTVAVSVSVAVAMAVSPLSRDSSFIFGVGGRSGPAAAELIKKKEGNKGPPFYIYDMVLKKKLRQVLSD